VRTFAAIGVAFAALLFGGCGGDTKHVSIDLKVNGSTVTTTSEAECERVKVQEKAAAACTTQA
jgi:hypothetical protein